MSIYSYHPDDVSAVSEGCCPDCHKRLIPVEVDFANGSSVVRWGWCYPADTLWRTDATPILGPVALGQRMAEVVSAGGHMRTLSAAELWSDS